MTSNASTSEPLEGELSVARRDTIDDGEVRGSITIAPAVLIELIELTARDIPGLLAIASPKRKGRGSVLAIQASEERETKGKTYQRGGVKVRIDGDTIAADITITIQTGAKVPVIGTTVQTRVATAVERMLGMRVTDINVHVVDIETVPNDKDTSS